MVFDTCGRFVSSFVQIGRAQQEVIKPTSFVIKNDTLIVVDANMLQTKSYSLKDYKYIGYKDIGFNTTHFLPTNSGKLLFAHNEYDRSKKHSDKLYVLTDDQHNMIDGFVDRVVFSGYGIGPSRSMYRQNNQIRMFSSYDPYIWTLNERDNATLLYEIKFDKYKLPTVEFVDKAIASGQFFREIENSDFVSFYNVIESNNEILIPFFVNTIPYIGIYDKQSKSTITITKERFNKTTGIELSYVAGVLKDCFVTPVFLNERENPTLFLFRKQTTL